VNAQYYYDFYEHPIYKGQQEAYKYFRISLKDTAIINAMNECNRKYREDLQNTEEKEKQDNIKKL
jgi:hypothetical protein